MLDLLGGAFIATGAIVLGVVISIVVIFEAILLYRRYRDTLSAQPTSNDTEAIALALVRLLYETADEEAFQWRMIRRLDRSVDEAIQYATVRGWIRIYGRGDIALTDAGRQRGEDLG